MKTLATKAALIAAVVLAGDQVTKSIARATLGMCDSPSFSNCEQLDFGVFGFAQVANAGSAMGFEQGLSLWVLVSVAGLLVIPLYATRLAPFGSLGSLAVGLQAGGALGNVLDRLFLGGVTDFIVIGRVIVINPADVALVVGMVLATALMMRQPVTEPARAGAMAG